jgi:hypothetical protein
MHMNAAKEEEAEFTTHKDRQTDTETHTERHMRNPDTI